MVPVPNLESCRICAKLRRMKPRTMVMVASLVLFVGVSIGLVGVWAYTRHPKPPERNEASDETVVDFAMTELRAATKEAVQRCGTALAKQELDAKVRVGTLLDGIEVLHFELVRSMLDAEQGACVAKAFVGKRGQRVGHFEDRIPEGREYEMEAHLVLPGVTADYNH